MKPGWPDLLVPEHLQGSHRQEFLGLDTGGTKASVSREKKPPRVHPSHVGGGSKIKSAVTICSSDRSEHITLELVSISDWDLLVARTDPAGRGCSGLFVGFYLLSFLFIYFTISL